MKDLATAPSEPAAAAVSPGSVSATNPAPLIRTTILNPAAMDRVDEQACWPQWLGPNRDGKSRETGLLQSWPPAGPALIWWLEGLGEGYSTVSIDHGLIYVTGMIDQQERLYCLDLQGQLRWCQSYGPAWSGRYPEARTTQQ